MMQRTCTPRGAASLGELLAVMTGLGVAMAVARMLKVTTQAISSGVADIEPWIWGRMVETTSKVVP